jgi:hypothetical protein
MGGWRSLEKAVSLVKCGGEKTCSNIFLLGKATTGTESPRRFASSL